MKFLGYMIGFIWLWTYPALATETTALSTLQSGQVVLSWEELKKLLEEIETLKKKQAEQAETVQPDVPPFDYSITEAHFTGEVIGKSAKLEATFSVHVLKTGWVTVPFFASEVGIETLQINASQPVTSTDLLVLPLLAPPQATSTPQAHFIRSAEGYALLTQGPALLTIQATLYVPVQVEDLTYRLSFLPPRSVINTIHLTIPETGVNLVKMNANSQWRQRDKATVVETVLSERDSLNLAWTIEKDSGLHRKSAATLQTLVSIDKSDALVFNTLILEHVADFAQMRLQLPAAVEILNVSSLDIAQWSTEKQAEVQLIKITGQPDPHAAVKIEVSYRLRLPALPTDLTVPTLVVTGVDTFEAVIGVEALGSLEILSKEVNDGLRIPAKNLPKALWQKASNPLLYGYQFYKEAFSPVLSVRSYQEIQTIVANIDFMDCVTHRTLEGKSMTRVIYFIRNNDRQFLSLTLPEKSRIWQAFLESKPVKPARKDSGEILIPMKKSAADGEALQSFAIEIGYVTEVNKLSLKGGILNQLPAMDIPVSYLRWRLYLPEYYEYSKFEGPLKQVNSFATSFKEKAKAQVDIPMQGQLFLFEKHLVVNEKPYVRGKYGQFLGDDIFLSLQPLPYIPTVDNKMDGIRSQAPASVETEGVYRRQVIPNRAVK